MATRKIFQFMKLDSLDPKVRWILWLPLAFAATSLVAMAVIVPTYIMRPSWQSLLVLLSNLVVIGLNMVSYLLFRRGRVTQGAWLLLLTTWWNLALSGVFYQGLGIILSVSVLFLTLVVVTQAITGRSRFWAILMGAVITYVVFGFDELAGTSLPWRITTFSTQLAYPILGGILLLAAIVLAVQFRNYTLTGKLITSFLGTTIIVAVFLAAITLYVSQSRLSGLIGSQLQFNATSEGVIIGDDLNKQVSLLKTLAHQNTLIQAVEAANARYTGSPEEIQAQIQQLDTEWVAAANVYDPLIWDRLHQPVAKDLRTFHILFSDHVEAFVTDQYGAILATTNRTSGYNQADEGWWQSAYNGGQGATYIGVPEYDESSESYAVYMAIPVRNNKNEAIGVLRTTYDVSALIHIINTSKIGETGEFDLIFPGEPAIIFHQGKTEPAGSEITMAMQSLGNKAYFQGNFAGQASLFSQAMVRSVDNNSDISSLNWRVLVHQTTQEALSPVQSQLRVSLMVVYLLVGVMALVGYGVSLVLSRPILQLTQVAEQVSAGDLTVRAQVDSRDEIGSLAKAFNNMTGQLSEMVGTLEQRVASRTRALVTTTEVSRRLSTILNQQELVSQVVEQVQTAFNYYHVHIYLYDEKQENLVMAGGTGEAGRTMLASGHRIARGRGLVGRAAENNQPILVGDTHQDPNWLSNPLLPDTQSEVAVPIAVGDTVLGVLDVQHNVVNGLTQADVDLIQSIAGQVAIGVQNARSFADTRRQAEREALISTISQKIRQTTSVDEALQVAVRELGRVVGAPHTRVRLGFADLETPAAKGE